MRFTYYYFHDGPWGRAYDVTKYRGPKRKFSRRAKKIDEDEGQEILEDIKNTKRGYRRYSRGQRPKSITLEAWNMMLESAKRRTC